MALTHQDAAPEAPPEDRLDATQVRDKADTSPRVARPAAKGRRVRAIPGRGGTTVRVNAKDFEANGIKNPTVEFDFRKDNFQLGVGKGKPLSEEAADFLTSTYPTSFEYMDQGE